MVTLIPFWQVLAAKDWKSNQMIQTISKSPNHSRQKGIKVTKPEDQKYRIEMVWISQIWLLSQALAAKTCPKGIKPKINKVSAWPRNRPDRTGPKFAHPDRTGPGTPWVLLRTTKYYNTVLLRTTQYYFVLHSTTKYCTVLLRTGLRGLRGLAGSTGPRGLPRAPPQGPYRRGPAGPDHWRTQPKSLKG